MTQTSTDLHWF